MKNKLLYGILNGDESVVLERVYVCKIKNRIYKIGNSGACALCSGVVCGVCGVMWCDVVWCGVM